MLRGAFKCLKGCQHGRALGIARIRPKNKMQGVNGHTKRQTSALYIGDCSHTRGWLPRVFSVKGVSWQKPENNLSYLKVSIGKGLR